MKYKNILLAVLAVMLILSAGAGSAWAYFTTYTEASGGYAIQLGSRSTMEEEFSNWTKHVVVSNNDDSQQPVFVRAKAFSGEAYSLTYHDGEGDAEGHWQEGEEGYYYYNKPLPAGASARILDIQIEGVPASEELQAGENFNVVVIYESTPVCYREDGTPYADWSMLLDNGTTEEGGATE